MEEVNFAKIEKKWQDKWEKEKIFEVDEKSKKPKFYVLEMFPYPSATGLHMGHAFNFTIGDVFARFKRMQGFNVLHPMGFDSLGLPAENAAIKAGQHPENYTNNSIKNFVKQQRALGLTYDWTRMVNTADSDYYKWDQWIFLKMFERGLVYQKEAAVNWCNKCNTILANEQVHEGKCWRHEDTEVEIKQMNQWYLKITDYADRLLEGHKKLNWPEKTIAMQKNWIGKSYGTEIDFEIINPNKKPTIFVVHGWCGNKDGNWFKWLKESTKENFNTIIPQFPNSTNPKLKEWISEIEKYKSELNEDSIMIGHSLGCPTICTFLEKNKIKIKKLILVAPCMSKYNKEDFEIIKKLKAPKESEEHLKKYLEELNIDFEKVRNFSDEIILYLSKDDKYVHKFDFRKEEYSKLNSKEKIFENKGHFNEEVGITSFPEILDDIKEKWSVFTTRPDTIFGVTFMVVSAQHQKLMDLVTKEQKTAVEKFLKKLKSVSEKEMADMEKEGVFTGSYAINPATGDKVPVYAGNFVVADYGAGMVMAVPAHDQRDFEFAKKYNIPIKQVVTEVKEDYTSQCKPRKEKEIIKRNSVVCVLKHWSEDKYLCLNWKNVNWHTPVTGGIDNGETPEEAGAREIKEETGYQNAEFLGRGLDVIGYYYHPKKDINRFEKQTPLFFKLKDGKQLKLSEEENAKHELVWVEKDKVEKFLNHDEKNYDARVALHVWSQYLNPRAITTSGDLINSKEFDGVSNEDAKQKITDWLISKKLARKVVNFKLRDWSVARQRYWGTPIPLIHCEKCGVVPVSEKDLPVKLPKEVEFGKGNPLLTNTKWLNVKCPKCNGKAKREANTMDTFVNSSWYFLRYCDPHNNKEIFAKEKAKYWMPIDLYIGGAEHACMHLIYCRFYTMFLHDIGLIDFEEPAPRLFHQGMINGSDGERMSKSKGNGVEPLETIAKYGVDATRFFLLSEASPDKGFNWSDKGIQGSVRIINKIWRISQEVKFGKDSEEFSVKLNKTIKNVSEQIENLDYRKSTIELRELFDLILKDCEVSKDGFGKALKLFAPFCPHITEELWERLGNKNFISLAEWPKYEKVAEQKNEIDLTEKIIANLKPVIEKLGQNQKINKIYLYVMPFEISKINKAEISKVVGKNIEIFSVSDAKKYDPENRSKKALPGKPGIFIE